MPSQYVQYLLIQTNKMMNTSNVSPRKKRARSSSSNDTNNNGSNYLSYNSSSNNRLLRLNVGGHPYDIIRTSLPLLETMMTDRWLDSCLLDSDGRIFLDRDGDAFGDVLRYLRGGADFLVELMNRSGRHHYYHDATHQSVSRHHSDGGAVSCGVQDVARDHRGHHNINGGSFNNYSASIGTTNHHHPGNTNYNNNHHQMDRLRRLRTEADYYGLHQLVHDIDSITIGSKIIFEEEGWGRVAGGFVGATTAATGVNVHDNNNQAAAGGEIGRAHV